MAVGLSGLEAVRALSWALPGTSSLEGTMSQHSRTWLRAIHRGFRAARWFDRPNTGFGKNAAHVLHADEQYERRRPSAAGWVSEDKIVPQVHQPGGRRRARRRSGSPEFQGQDRPPRSNDAQKDPGGP